MENCDCHDTRKGDEVRRSSVPKRRSRCLKMNLLTWNTNGKPPPSDMHNLLIRDADVYAIGLQEMGSQNWEFAFDITLVREDVVRVKCRKLQGIKTIMYVKRELLPFVTHIESEITKTGFGGFWGNKGAVSIRMDIYGVNLVVVNCHLAPHQDSTGDRVQNINEIIDNHKFRDTDVDNILDHDYIYWIGDLNFRLDNISYEKALESINKKNINALICNDQLKSLMRDGVIFTGFQEPPIHFNPTYKFDIGTDIYDTSAKKRIPGYCDRILYYHHKVSYGRKNELKVKSSNYRSHTSYKYSDHKPVSCVIDFYGLCRPPVNPVIFKLNKGICRTTDLSVSYYSRDMELSSSDWIGLYYASFKNFNVYITYQWATVSNYPSPYNGSVCFPSSYLTEIPEGVSVVLCYMSKMHSFSGISEQFRITN